MKITKYEHACLVVEEEGKHLVIDPGMWTTSLPANLDNIVAVVITHVHQDHWDKQHIDDILAKNPNAQIYGTAEVAEELKPIQVNVVSGNDSANVEPFELKFFGGQHALIHQSIPPVQNVGVMVNDLLYYPGDSFSKPEGNIKVLAIPASAPWMKLAEAMDFLTEVKPELAFPTHNSILSDNGASLADRLLSTAQGFGGKYQHLDAEESIDVNAA